MKWYETPSFNFLRTLSVYAFIIYFYLDVGFNIFPIRNHGDDAASFSQNCSLVSVQVAVNGVLFITFSNFLIPVLITHYVSNSTSNKVNQYKRIQYEVILCEFQIDDFFNTVRCTNFYDCLKFYSIKILF